MEYAALLHGVKSLELQTKEVGKLDFFTQFMITMDNFLLKKLVISGGKPSDT